MPTTTQQVSKTPPNPTGKGGFGDNPRNQSPGGWKKENTISYQYNRFMNMTRKELLAFGRIPDADKTMAMQIAYARVLVASSAKGLSDAKEIADRTEGKSKEFIDLTSGGDKIQFGNMVPRNADTPST